MSDLQSILKGASVHVQPLPKADVPEASDPGWKPADDVNRAKSIVLTVWLALGYPDFAGGCSGDVSAVADTLYEAYQRLQRAEKNMGVYK